MRFNKGIGGRIFNPVDFKKWDPECKYVKKWLPELKDIPNNHLHNWPVHWKKYDNIKYPKPIVDFETRKNIWKQKTAKI